MQCSHIVTVSCHSQRSTQSGSATHCRSSAGRYWQFRAAQGLDNGLCGRWGCGWRKSGDTGPAGAACPGRMSCCIRTTLQYPSCSEEIHKSLVLGRYPWQCILHTFIYVLCIIYYYLLLFSWLYCDLFIWIYVLTTYEAVKGSTYKSFQLKLPRRWTENRC